MYVIIVLHIHIHMFAFSYIRKFYGYLQTTLNCWLPHFNVEIKTIFGLFTFLISHIKISTQCKLIFYATTYTQQNFQNK